MLKEKIQWKTKVRYSNITE